MHFIINFIEFLAVLLMVGYGVIILIFTLINMATINIRKKLDDLKKSKDLEKPNKPEEQANLKKAKEQGKPEKTVKTGKQIPRQVIK